MTRPSRHSNRWSNSNCCSSSTRKSRPVRWRNCSLSSWRPARSSISRGRMRALASRRWRWPVWRHRQRPGVRPSRYEHLLVPPSTPFARVANSPVPARRRAEISTKSENLAQSEHRYKNRSTRPCAKTGLFRDAPWQPLTCRTGQESSHKAAQHHDATVCASPARLWPWWSRFSCRYSSPPRMTRRSRHRPKFRSSCRRVPSSGPSQHLHHAR